MTIEDYELRHLVPKNTSTTEGYTTRSSGARNKPVVPALDRQQHATSLRAQLAEVGVAQLQRVTEQRQLQIQTAIGLQVEFQSQHAVALAAESLARDNQGIELLNVRTQGDQVLATVFVPEGKLSHFERLLTDYVEQRTDKNGKPRDGRPLVDAILAVRVAVFESLWTDSDEVLPGDHEPIWWEAWLPAGEHRGQRIADFRRIANLAGFEVRDQALHFPERSVVLLHGTKAQFLGAGLVMNMVAELRRNKETAAFFTALPLNEQADWLAALQTRMVIDETPAAYVTLLDTGVNRGHPLLQPHVADADLHTVQPDWGLDDTNGHGTQLAGLALFGDLTPVVAETSAVEVHHRLESVKILRGPGDNADASYGAITAEAVGRVEVTDPNRRRTFAMAISATDGRDRGRPSSWSAEVDRLACDYEGHGESPRLFVLCAGNIEDQNAWAEHPASLSTNAVHDPGQAWNALTVGAFTELTAISEDDAQQYVAVAPAGGLSPFTTTSATWQSDWPFKPDVVMEGGNAALDAPGGFACSMDSLSLLTIDHEPFMRLFTTSWATSAATALAAGMAADIQAEYPGFWPETVRALMVHSARWTQAMLDEYAPGNVYNKTSLRNLLRHCGYGAPSRDRALFSARNSLTLIVQDQLQPYEKEAGGTIKTRDMHLHSLPWPVEILEALGDATVTLRVTLSYFIEPNPGDRGGIDKYAYQSHALRFQVRRPLETEAAFRGRINAQAADEDQGLGPAATDAGWLIGAKLRARGSLVSDSWTGIAAELANRGQLAVYPAMGWWRNRPGHGRFHRAARYALLVSIEAPEVTQDLYSAVAAQIQVPIAVAVDGQ